MDMRLWLLPLTLLLVVLSETAPASCTGAKGCGSTDGGDASATPPPQYSITQVLQTMESLAPEIHAPVKTLRNVLECILLLMARDDGSAEPPGDGWVGMGNAVDEHLSRVRQFVDIEVIIVLMQHRVSGRLTDVQRQRAVRLFMECCGIDATSNQPAGRCSSHRYLLHVSSCSYRAWLSFLVVDDDSGLCAQSGLWNSMISYQDVLQLRIEALPSPGKITIMIGRGSLDISTSVKGLLMRCQSRLGDTGCEMFASPVATSGFGTYRCGACPKRLCWLPGAGT